MELEQLYKSYKDYKCKIEGKSENSVNQYIYRIQDFIKYNNIKNSPPSLGGCTIIKIRRERYR